jgi:hypothetical protein
VAEDSKSDAPAYDDPREPRRYSGKVSALIIVAIVVVFVLLNFASDRFIPRPDRPPTSPTIVPATP